jgi:hypothetical protein
MKKILLILLFIPFISFGQTDTLKINPYIGGLTLTNITTQTFNEIELGIIMDGDRFGLTVDNRKNHNLGFKFSFGITKNFYINIQPKVSFKFNEFSASTGLEYNRKIYKNLTFILGGNIENAIEGNFYLINTGLRLSWN